MREPIANFGDDNFIEYGGQLLYPPDEDGESWLEVIEPPPDDAGPDQQTWEVYRVEIEKFKVVENENHLYLVTECYQPDWPHPVQQYDEWFHKELVDVADSVGLKAKTLRDDLCSDDPQKRVWSYIAVAGYWGWRNFDHYPLYLTEHEVRERYGELEDCECKKCKEES